MLATDLTKKLLKLVWGQVTKKTKVSRLPVAVWALQKKNPSPYKDSLLDPLNIDSGIRFEPAIS